MGYLQFLITTTGASGDVALADLGNRTLPNSLVAYDLGQEFTIEELRYSKSLAAAIFNDGWTATDSLGKVITAQASLALTEQMLNKAGHPQSTDDLPEGTTNKFASAANVQAALGSLSINDLSDVNLTGIASGDILKWNGTEFQKLTLNTTNVPEGTNLYYTNSRARQAVSIAAGSSQYLSYDNVTGQFSISALAITSVHVDSSSATLAAFVAASYTAGTEFQEGDVVILAAATGGVQTWIHNGGTAGTVADFTQIEAPALSDSYIRALLSSGEGINYNSTTGQIAVKLETVSGLEIGGASGLKIKADITTADVIALNLTANGAGIKYGSAYGLTESSDELRVNLDAAGGLVFDGVSGAIKVKADVTTGATVAPLSVVANGVGVTVDNVTIEHNVGALRIKADGVNYTHIDWGTGVNQVNASSVPLKTYTWATITAPTDVQDALEKIDAAFGAASKKTWVWGASSSATVNTNRYLDKFDGVATNESPYVAFFACKIRAVSLSSNAASTWTAEVRVNGVAVATLASGGSQYNQESALNISVAAGSRVSFYVNGTAVNKPSIDALFEEA